MDLFLNHLMILPGQSHLIVGQFGNGYVTCSGGWGGFLLQKGESVHAADPACRVPPDVCHPLEDQAAARAGRAERRKEPGVTLPR